MERSLPLLLLLLLLLARGGAAERLEALVPGDILIGALFALHEDVSRDDSFSPHVPQCVRPLERGVMRALAMVDAVQRVNSAPLMTEANLTLGLWIQDSCSDVGTALRATEQFTRVESCEGRRPIMALIGATHSELSIAVARQLALRMIPQISYSSTAAILSDKSRFPTFLRTIPSDQHQTGAMVRLLSAYDWSWVGLVTSDGDYGRSALDLLLSQSSERSICVAFRAMLSASDRSVSAQIRDVARTIYSSPRVRVIVSFASPALMTQLWAELKTQALAAGDSVDSVRRVWIASDSWSFMSLENVEDMEGIGHVIGFHFRTVTSRLSGREGTREREVAWEGEGYSRPELKAFYRMLKAEHGEDVEKRLSPELHTDTVFSVQMAVVAIAHATVEMCKDHDCKTPGAVQPWQLLRSLWMEEFEMGGERFTFDRRGDINLGYDVSLWRVQSGVVLRETVLEYHPQNNSFTNKHTRNPLHALRSVVSRCSDRCAPGQFKKSAEGQHTCCYECINCTQNYYSNSTDMDQCLSCDTDREWSPEGSADCVPKRPLFFCWDNGFAITLASLSALGIVLALLMSALFFRRRQTPVVRAAGGPLSQVMLHSLVVSFVSVLLFVGRPNNLQCKARQVLFGISFTVCVACVLVKTLQILLAFQFNPTLQAALRRLYRPYAVVSACVAVQAAMCIIWLVLKSPSAHVLNQNTTLLHDCHEGSYLAFGAMLGYIALLALVCFVCAFKCRKLPQQYNEARFITFSMLLYLMAWLLFVPIYVTTSGVYLPAVEMVVILISNYGILSCHFFPKCYVMLFRKDKNTQSAFRKTIYEYASKSKSKSTLSASSSESPADAVSSNSTNEEVKGSQDVVLSQDSKQRRCLRRSSSV
ncbi:unnamed protein product [Knipowitschia caucasica]